MFDVRGSPRRMEPQGCERPAFAEATSWHGIDGLSREAEWSGSELSQSPHTGGQAVHRRI